MVFVRYYNEEEQRLFWKITIVITFLSGLGSLAIIISYVLLSHIRNANSRIILSLRFD